MDEMVKPKEIIFPAKMIDGHPYTLDGERMLAPGTRMYSYYWRDNFELSKEEMEYVIDKMLALEKHYNALKNQIHLMDTQLTNAEGFKTRGILP